MRIELINFRRTVAALQIIATPIGTAPLSTNHVTWAVLDHNSQFAVGAFTPALRIAGAAVGTNGAALTLSGPANGQYQVDYSSSLTAPSWNVLGQTVLTNGAATFLDPASPSANPQRFYRARQ